MSFYPVLLDLTGRNVLVVGGGQVAQRKVENFLEYGAKISITARELTDNLTNMVESKRVVFLGKEFFPHYLDEAFLVIAATNDKDLNHRVSEEANRRGMLVNTVDQPAGCNFIVPSIIRRGDLLVAISTSGKSPAMAKRIREEIEGQFGPEYETTLTLMGRVREAVLASGLPQSENSRIFHAIAGSDIVASIKAGDWSKVRGVLDGLLPSSVARDGITRDLATKRGR
jgi:precorrin-2 dehydrogenase / sirohydrochlorin ferrochelatase